MRLAINEKPRSETIRDIKGDFLYFKMREGAGIELIDSAGQNHFENNRITLAGAGAGQWANEGWFTPDGTNHTTLIPDSTDGVATSGIADFFGGMADLHGVGGLLIMFDYWAETTPIGADEYIFSWHPANSIAGGIGLRIGTSGLLQLHWRAPGLASNFPGIATVVQLTNGGLGQRNSIVAYIDMKNIVSGTPDKYPTYSYVNGVAYTPGQVSAGFPVSDTTIPYQGFSLFADNNDAGVNKILNAAATPSNSKINNFLIKKCNSDAVPFLADLANQHLSEHFDIPRSILRIS